MSGSGVDGAGIPDGIRLTPAGQLLLVGGRHWVGRMFSGSASVEREAILRRRGYRIAPC